MLPVTFTQVKVLIKNSLQPLNVHWESFYLKVIICWIEQLTIGKDKKKLRALSICQNFDWPDHSHHNENFTFYQNYPARSVKSLIVCTNEMIFQQKPFGKSQFHLLTDWSGNGPVSQFWLNGKRPKVAIGLK